jgi:hypothetical protein
MGRVGRVESNKRKERVGSRGNREERVGRAEIVKFKYSLSKICLWKTNSICGSSKFRKGGICPEVTMKIFFIYNRT